MQIKDLAIGDGFVYLMEGSTKVKFYALSHNYESRLNGKGRTLFCRESPAGSGTHTTSAKEDYRVDSNNEDAWYKNTYVNKFSGEVRKLIGMTKYIGQYVHMTYTQSGNPTGNAEIDSETYESSFFPLSTAEVALRAFADGSALSSAAISRIASIQTRYGSGIWTRSPSRVLTGTNSTGFPKYYYANSQYISGASGSSLSTAEGTPGSSYGYLPCFTLPETLYIDKDGGVSINDCEAVSRPLSDALDEADPIEGSYVLEVSSAGADRPLKKPAHFQQFLGAEVDVRLYRPLDGRKEYTGVLKGYDGGDVTIETAGEARTFVKKDVAQVRLTVHF